MTIRFLSLLDVCVPFLFTFSFIWISFVYLLLLDWKSCKRWPRAKWGKSKEFPFSCLSGSLGFMSCLFYLSHSCPFPRLSISSSLRISDRKEPGRREKGWHLDPLAAFPQLTFPSCPFTISPWDFIDNRGEERREELRDKKAIDRSLVTSVSSSFIIHPFISCPSTFLTVLFPFPFTSDPTSCEWVSWTQLTTIPSLTTIPHLSALQLRWKELREEGQVVSEVVSEWRVRTAGYRSLRTTQFISLHH